MKWLDVFLNQFFFLLFKFFFLFLNILSSIIQFTLNKLNLFFRLDLYKLSHSLLSLCFVLLSSLFSLLFFKIPTILRYLLYTSLFSLINPLLFKLKPYISKYPSIKHSYSFFLGAFISIYMQISITLSKLFSNTWKLLIDFFFFSVYKNKTSIINNFIWLRNFFTKLLIIYAFFLNNSFIFIFLPNYLDLFTCWDFDSLVGCLLVFISFLNIDNLSLLSYTIYFTGVLNIFLLRFDDFLLFSGFSWLSTFYEFRVFSTSTPQQSIFLYYFFDHFIYTKISYLVNFDFDSTPIFFFFWRTIFYDCNIKLTFFFLSWFIWYIQIKYFILVFIFTIFVI